SSVLALFFVSFPLHRSYLYLLSFPTRRSSDLGICLAVFNLIFILGTVIAVIGVIFGLFIAAISFVISPIAVTFKLFFGNGYLFEFFISLVLVVIGLLLLSLLIKFS